MKTRQFKKLAAAVAMACAASWAHSSFASVSYKYVTDQTSYTASPGGNVTVQIFLQETLTGNSTSLITADGGLYNGGFVVNGGGASGGAFDAAIAGNSTNFPSGMAGGGFFALPGNSNSSRGGQNTTAFGATSGPTPTGGLISLGTVTVTAGSAGNSTQFTLGAIPTFGQVDGGYTQTFGNSDPNNGMGYYDLDVSESSPNPYTGVGNTLSLFTVTVAPSATSNMFWKGALSSNWNTTSGNSTNWRTDATSNIDTQATPTSLTNVFLSATGASNLSTMALGQDTAINSLSFLGNATATTIAAGNTLTLNAANAFLDQSSNTYAAGIGLVVQAGAAAHTINANVNLAANQTWQINNAASSPLTVNGNISGASLTESGTGTLSLTGNNTYSGTIINGGALRANNASGSATGSGEVDVNTGGTLGGNGTIGNSGGTIFVNSSGTITAGSNATTTGKLATQAQAWAVNGEYLWKTTGNGSVAGSSGANGSDLLTMTNLAVTAGSGTPFNVALSGSSTVPIGAGAATKTFVIGQMSGTVTLNGVAEHPTLGSPIILASGHPSTDPFVLNTSAFTDDGVAVPASAFTLEFAADPVSGIDLDLVYNAAPEPGSALLVLAGAVPLLAGRGRRRRSPSAP